MDLSGNPIADPALEHLAKLSNLQILSLMHTGVRGSGLAPLSHMPKLEVVLLAGTPLDDSAVEHLARLPNLKRLDLRGTTITPEGLAKLKQALPNCQILPP